jgi:hypothetical protein
MSADVSPNHCAHRLPQAFLPQTAYTHLGLLIHAVPAYLVRTTHLPGKSPDSASEEHLGLEDCLQSPSIYVAYTA